MKFYWNSTTPIHFILCKDRAEQWQTLSYSQNRKYLLSDPLKKSLLTLDLVGLFTWTNWQNFTDWRTGGGTQKTQVWKREDDKVLVRKIALASMAQLVGVPSCTLKSCGFEPLSEHTPGLQCQSPVREPTGGDRLTFLFLSFCLPSSL